MKDLISQAGMLSGAGFSGDANCLQGKQSAIAMLHSTMYSIRYTYDKYYQDMNLLARVEPDSRI